MSKVLNGIPIHQVLSLIAGDMDDELVCNRVSRVAKDVRADKDRVTIEFESGLILTIKSTYGDYNLYISDLRVYKKGDDPFGLYSYDRMKYYLDLICKRERKVDVNS